MFDWFRDFMRYRNGLDTLNKVLLAIAIVSELLHMITRFPLLSFTGSFAIVLCIFRYLSKNIPARQRENEFFLNLKDKIFSRRNDKNSPYKMFKCMGCGRTLRVPKGKGKIEVTCPICGAKRIYRS